MIWITADTHFQHFNCLKYCNRPFETIQEHDDHLINKINEFVGRNDKLYHLGDFCFSRRGHKEYVRTARALLDRINCDNIFFIQGNHDAYLDRIGPGNIDHHRKVKFVVPYYELYVQIPVHRQITKELIVLNHYPQYTWNKSHYGAHHFYGHHHSTEEENLDKISANRRSIDVGIDNANLLLGDYQPFELNWLLNFLQIKSCSEK